MGKLSAAKVRSALEPGRYSDGDGLYLLVSDSDARMSAYGIAVTSAEQRLLAHSGPHPASAFGRERTAIFRVTLAPPPKTLVSALSRIIPHDAPERWAQGLIVLHDEP